MFKLLKILIFYWKRISKKKKQKQNKKEDLEMLLGALGGNLLENMLTGKRMLRASYGSKMDF